MKNKIRAAVVGLGIGEQHAQAYISTEFSELGSLFDLDSEKTRSVATRLGTGTETTSYEAILADPKIHLVSIASFDDSHFDQVVAALAAGKHVFVEKPLCRTLDELRVIKDLWSSNQGNIKLSSNLVLRAAPLYQWLRQKLEQGELGIPYAFDGDYLFGRLEKITHGWRKNVKNYSVMLGGGIHLVDLMVWLMGERPVSVYATGNNICAKDSAFSYKDFVTAMFQFPSGLVGRITANFGCVHRHQHVLRLFGTDATFIYDDSGARLHVTRDPAVASEPVDLPGIPAQKGTLIPGFVKAIVQDEDLNEHTQQIFDVISICIACDKALRTKTITEINYV